MTAEIAPEVVAALAEQVGPVPDDILVEMEDRARTEEFPIVGSTVGGWLQLVTRLVDARRVFEFGSGFGYSAYWFARGLPEDGRVVLTEIDADQLDRAREYFERGGFEDRAAFEHGDAIDVVANYDGPFDVVLLDNEKERYVEAFEAVRDKLHSGSVVLADNAVTAGPVDSDDVLALLQGEQCPDATEASAGVAAYLDHVRALDGFETVLLPLGEGMALSLQR